MRELMLFFLIKYLHKTAMNLFLECLVCSFITGSPLVALSFKSRFLIRNYTISSVWAAHLNVI